MENVGKEIMSREEVKILVDLFYEKVQKDDTLADIFNSIIKNRWPQHLEKMYRFWETVLLGEKTYRGNPFLPHSELQVNKTHFDRWIELFVETVDENFYGEKAEESKWRAEKMAEMFQTKMEYYLKHPNRIVI